MSLASFHFNRLHFCSSGTINAYRAPCFTALFVSVCFFFPNHILFIQLNLPFAVWWFILIFWFWTSCLCTAVVVFQALKNIFILLHLTYFWNVSFFFTSVMIYCIHPYKKRKSLTSCNKAPHLVMLLIKMYYAARAVAYSLSSVGNGRFFTSCWPLHEWPLLIQLHMPPLLSSNVWEAKKISSRWDPRLVFSNGSSDCWLMQVINWCKNKQTRQTKNGTMPI